MTLRAPISPKLEGDAEAVRRSHDQAIRELQATRAASMVVVSDVELEDGVATPVAHRLGKAPSWVGVSVVRNATSTGRIVESRSGNDRSRSVTLTATGWGATITVDLLVVP